mgnify:CR=1 FL=1
MAGRLASDYLRLGLRPGDRVASQMPNRAELLVHYLACMRAGLVAVPLNYRYTAPEIDHALGIGGARMPLNATGKVDRATLKRWAAEGRPELA